MRKLVTIAIMLVSIAATAAPAPKVVNEKVLKAFNETFTIAQEVTWQEFEDYYQANFKQEEVQLRAQYDANGNLLKTIRYYSEKELLPNIIAKLKTKYAGKTIEGVTETTSNDEVSFVISLKDDTNWYIVKSDAYARLELTKKFKRADK